MGILRKRLFTKGEGSQKEMNVKDSDYSSLIFQYIKRNKKIVGLLIGVRCGSEISIGWSLCNIKKDEFEMETALAICYTRLSRMDKIPPSILPDVEKFAHRCYLYFSGTKSRGKRFIINYKNFVGNFTKSKIGGKDFWHLIPVEIKTKYSMLYNQFMNELNRIPQEIDRNTILQKNEKVFGVLYCKEMELSGFEPFDYQPSYPIALLTRNVTFRGVSNEKIKGSHIKVTWEFIDEQN